MQRKGLMGMLKARQDFTPLTLPPETSLRSDPFSIPISSTPPSLSESTSTPCTNPYIMFKVNQRDEVCHPIPRDARIEDGYALRVTDKQKRTMKCKLVLDSEGNIIGEALFRNNATTRLRTGSPSAFAYFKVCEDAEPFINALESYKDTYGKFTTSLKKLKKFMKGKRDQQVASLLATTSGQRNTCSLAQSLPIPSSVSHGFPASRGTFFSHDLFSLMGWPVSMPVWMFPLLSSEAQSLQVSPLLSGMLGQASSLPLNFPAFPAPLSSFVPPVTAELPVRTPFTDFTENVWATEEEVAHNQKRKLDEEFEKKLEEFDPSELSTKADCLFGPSPENEPEKNSSLQELGIFGSSTETGHVNKKSRGEERQEKTNAHLKKP